MHAAIDCGGDIESAGGHGYVRRKDSSADISLILQYLKRSSASRVGF